MANTKFWKPAGDGLVPFYFFRTHDIGVVFADHYSVPKLAARAAYDLHQLTGLKCCVHYTGAPKLELLKKASGETLVEGRVVHH